jgi:hypothetical protein
MFQGLFFMIVSRETYHELKKTMVDVWWMIYNWISKNSDIWRYYFGKSYSNIQSEGRSG